MFLQLLRVQLILKGIVTQEDWENMQPYINFTFNRDSYFNDIKDSEILASRIELASAMEPLIGKYFSSNYIRKHILKQNEDEIKQIDEEMAIDIQKQKQAEMEQMQIQMQMQQQEQQEGQQESQ
jgi:hypothetical protein